MTLQHDDPLDEGKDVLQCVQDDIVPAIRKIASLADARRLNNVEIRLGELCVTFDRAHTHEVAAPPPPAPESASPETPPFADAVAKDLVPVVSQRVGIFLRATHNGPPGIDNRGTQVRKGDILGYIESMQLQHEVVSPIDGRLTDTFVDEGHPVEYGQPLMVLEPQDV